MINKPRSDSNRVNGKKAGILAKMALLLFLAVAGVEESKAQRDITKDTTEVRAFFNNPEVFSAEWMAEFDIIWQEMLNNPRSEHIMEYLYRACNNKQSDHENVVLTHVLLDPEKKTSLGKRAYEEIEKDLKLKKKYKLISESIYWSEYSEKKTQEIKKNEEIIKKNEEIIKKNEEIAKEDWEFIKKKKEEIKQNEEKIKQNEEKIKQNEEKIKQNEEKIKQNEEEIKRQEKFGKHLDDMLDMFKETSKDKK